VKQWHFAVILKCVYEQNIWEKYGRFVRANQLVRLDVKERELGTCSYFTTTIEEV
jgi:hypothetical protein